MLGACLGHSLWGPVSAGVWGTRGVLAPSSAQPAVQQHTESPWQIHNPLLESSCWQYLLSFFLGNIFFLFL